MADVRLIAELVGFDTIGSKFKELGDSLSTTEGKLGLLSTASKGLLGLFVGGAGITAAFAAAASKFTDTADNLSKMSQKVGISTEDLSKLKYAAELSGTSIEGMQAGLIRLSVNASEASKGSKTAAEAFSDLGISVTDSTGAMKSNKDLLREVAEKFKAMPDGIEKTNAVVKLFGKSGAELIPLLNGGADGLDRMGVEAEKLGQTISNDTGKASEEFNDNLERLKKTFSGIVNQVITPFIPMISDIASGLVAWIEETDALRVASDALVIGFRVVFTAVLILKNGIDNVVDVIIGMAKTAYYVMTGDFKKAFESAKDTVNDVGQNYEDVFRGVEKLWSTNNKVIKEEATKTAGHIKATNKATQADLEEGQRQYRINKEINDKAIEREEEETRRRMALGQQLYEENKRINDEATAEKIKQNQKGIRKAFSEWFKEIEEETKDTWYTVGTIITDTMDSGTRSIGTGVADWIVEGKKFNLDSVFKMMAKQFIAQLVTMGIRSAAFFVAQEAGWVTVGATGAAAGTAVSIAWGPLTLAMLAIVAAIYVLWRVFEEFGPVGVAIGLAVSAAWFPVAAPFIAIGAAIAAIILLIKNFDEVSAWIKDRIKDHWDFITLPFRTLIDIVEKVIKAVKELIGYIKDALGLGGDLGKISIGGHKVGLSDLDPTNVSIGGHKLGDLNPFATGGEFITSGPKLIMVGERGAERVSINPAGSFDNKTRPTQVNVVFNGPAVFDEISAAKFARIQQRYLR